MTELSSKLDAMCKLIAKIDCPICAREHLIIDSNEKAIVNNHNNSSSHWATLLIWERVPKNWSRNSKCSKSDIFTKLSTGPKFLVSCEKLHVHIHKIQLKSAKVYNDNKLQSG